jgi:Cof subfamily protein (haloacid dehalogenase superfamily)
MHRPAEPAAEALVHIGIGRGRPGAIGKAQMDGAESCRRDGGQSAPHARVLGACHPPGRHIEDGQGPVARDPCPGDRRLCEILARHRLDGMAPYGGDHPCHQTPRAQGPGAQYDNLTMEPNHLLVTDLDGTLLRSDESVSDFAAATLNAAIADGLALTYCTSRSFFAARSLCSRIDFRLPAIVSNGAFAVDARSGEVLRATVLDRSLAAAVVAEAGRRGWSPFVCGFSGGREVVAYRPPLNPGQADWVARRQRRGDRRLTPVSRLAVPDVVYELLFLEDEAASQDLAGWLPAAFGSALGITRMAETYFPGCFSVEVANPAANKATTLRWLAERLAIRPDRLTVFGDNLNDLPMFGVAGQRIAVANAQPAVRSAADLVIASNDDDGVARFVASLRAPAVPALP